MVTALAEDVWWYDLRGVNAYLVEDDDATTLVDTGMPFSRRQLILGLDRVGYGASDIDRVFLTHFDVDHVGALGRLQRLEAPVYVGAPDAPFVTGEQKPTWRNHKGLLQRVFSTVLSPPVDPVEPVEDGDEIGSFTVYHTPGHTPGHVCFISENLSVGFLGDLVREREGQLEASPWHLSYDSHQVETSIERLARDAPDFEVAAMGHGVPFRRRGSERLRELAASL